MNMSARASGDACKEKPDEWRNMVSKKTKRRTVGYIILWDGQGCGFGGRLGTLDGHIAIDTHADLFKSKRKAQEAIDKKKSFYSDMARKYPDQDWPNTDELNFEILAVRG